MLRPLAVVAGSHYFDWPVSAPPHSDAATIKRHDSLSRNGKMKLRSLSLLAALVACASACGSSSSEPASTVTQPPPVDLTKVVSVAVTPPTVAGGLASSIQLAAVAKNVNGDAITTQPTITWKSSDTTIATVSSGGLAHGVGIGTATITATAGGINGTAAATMVLHPNEPANFTRIAEDDFASLPGLSGLLGTLAGNFYTQASPASHFAVLTDPTALQSPSSVLQVDFQSGTQPGFETATGFRVFGGWDGANPLSNTEYGEYYESTMLKIPTPDFETQLVGVKILGYWGVGNNNQPAATGAGPVTLFGLMRGSGGGTTIMSSWNLDMYTQGITSTAVPQNKNLSTKITAGAWHQFETYMKLNTIGQSNGVWKWWLDGVLIGDYENMQFINSTHSSGFFGRSMALVWGGQGGTPKTRTDYVWFNHMYMSGVFLRAAAP
jgi:Bacterial Ig-like domain (group 2)